MKKESFSPLALTLALMIFPAVVYAHTYIVSSEPQKNAVLQAVPKKVTINFLNTYEPDFSKLEVFDQSGAKVSKQTKFLENNSVMETELADGLKSGEFTVKWVCFGVDGHKTQGSYKFTVK